MFPEKTPTSAKALGQERAQYVRGTVSTMLAFKDRSPFCAENRSYRNKSRGRQTNSKAIAVIHMKDGAGWNQSLKRKDGEKSTDSNIYQLKLDLIGFDD